MLLLIITLNRLQLLAVTLYVCSLLICGHYGKTKIMSGVQWHKQDKESTTKQTSQKLFLKRRARISEIMWKTAWLTDILLPWAKPVAWLRRLQTFVVNLIVRQENPINKTRTKSYIYSFTSKQSCFPTTRLVFHGVFKCQRTTDGTNLIIISEALC